MCGLAATKGTTRRRLLEVLDEVKRSPFRAGDFQQRDAAGHLNEVLLIGDWLVTYWSDHAVAEIRVVDLEPVEE